MPKTKTVLLMGATGGVGYDAAELLKRKGFQVIATCRNPAQQAELEKDLVCDKAVLLDLSDTESIERAFSELRASGITELDGLVNCAARLVGTPLETVSLEETRAIFETNVFGTLRAVQLAIGMLRPRQGRIVLVGSLAGSFVMPMTGIYSASKFALEAICDGLRRELYPWGIRVVLVKPGAIDTRMYRGHLENVRETIESLEKENERLYAPLYRAHARMIPKTSGTAVPTKRVAGIILQALTAKNPKVRYFPGIESRLIRMIEPVLPDRWLDRMSAAIFALKDI